MPSMTPQAQDAVQRLVFVLIMLIFFMNGPQNNAVPNVAPIGRQAAPRDTLKASLARQRHSLNILNGTAWDAWKYGAEYNPVGKERGGGSLNLTGFRESDGYLWDSVWGGVKERVGKMREEVWRGRDQRDLAVYRNVTAQVMGEWVRSDIGLGGEKGWMRPGNQTLNLTNIQPNLAWGWSKWNRNITSMAGAMELTVKERDLEKKAMLYGEGNEEKVIREVEAFLKVEDESHGGDGWQMALHGVHWPEQGTLLLTTTSEKFAGIYGLPHLTLTKEHFTSSQMILNRTLEHALEQREMATWGIPQDPFNGGEESLIPHCEYVVYAHVHPVGLTEVYNSPVPKLSEDLQADISALEHELRFPNGAPVVKPPPLTMSLLAFSPDCGFVLESKGPPKYTPAEGLHLQGLKIEVYVKHIKHWALVWGVALMFQVALLRQQMKEASTPSTISRISLYTAGMMAVADFIVVGALIMLAATAPIVFPTATLTAFGACLSMGLGVRFLAEVYNVQEPERREANRVRDAALAVEYAAFRARRDAFLAIHRRAVDAASAAREAAVNGTTNGTAAPVITAAGVDLPLPTPITASSIATPQAPSQQLPGSFPDPPTIIPSDQDIDAQIAEDNAAVTDAIADTLPTTNPVVTPQILEAVRAYRGQDIAKSYGQLMMGLLIFFFITISTPSWPTILRRIYFNIVGLTYFSLWIPQIVRNAKRNCRKAFQWRFVAGQSILRLLPWAYVYLKEDNVFFATRSLFGICLLVAWVWIQILILVAMDVLGPRFALPRGWLPEAWDYHPLLREDDVEGGGLPLGLVRTPSSPRLERRTTGDETVNRRSDHDIMSVDCAICMQKLEVPVLGKGEENSKAVGMTGLLARRVYMVTPCRHMFHSKCLEGWMKYRLQCPICRENLPSL